MNNFLIVKVIRMFKDSYLHQYAAIKEIFILNCLFRLLAYFLIVGNQFFSIYNDLNNGLFYRNLLNKGSYKSISLQGLLVRPKTLTGYDCIFWPKARSPASPKPGTM